MLEATMRHTDHELHYVDPKIEVSWQSKALGTAVLRCICEGAVQQPIISVMVVDTRRLKKTPVRPVVSLHPWWNAPRSNLKIEVKKN